MLISIFQQKKIIFIKLTSFFMLEIWRDWECTDTLLIYIAKFNIIS